MNHHLSIPLVAHRPLAVSLGGNLHLPGIGRQLTPPTGDPEAWLTLLHEIEFEADLFLLQPAGDVAAELQQALAFCSHFGEGIVVADENKLAAVLADRSLQPHVWAHLTMGRTGVLYFAKAVQSGTRHLACAAEADAVHRACTQLQRDRLKLRRGPEASREYATVTEDTGPLWQAAREEWDRRAGKKPAWNITLKGGLVRCHLSKFDAYSTRTQPGTVAQLFSLNGKSLPQIIVNRTLRQVFTECLQRWRVPPPVHAAWLTARREAMARLQALRAGIPKTELPAGLNATLRPYQKDGFDFLVHLSRLGQGGILADDMGLGKTLQTLAWLLWLKQQQSTDPFIQPSLVICPASVMHNWRREAEKFVPELKVLVLESGPKRAAVLSTLNSQLSTPDLIITNYSLLRRDLAVMAGGNFLALILDEAQFIKNPDARITKAVKQVSARHRLALTGTPIENRLLDLWSIVDFAAPGYLGERQEFTTADSPAARRDLRRQLRPLLLRRLKQQVAADLPARIEQRLDCLLPAGQMALYQAELRRSRAEVWSVVAAQGIVHSRLHVLAALTRLRQICCHPGLVGQTCRSAKTEALFELLDTLVASGKKVLVFSQFTKMLDILHTECRRRQFKTGLLTGATRDRQAVVDAFNADGQVFLLSLRAAGTGLNLTSASEVILYDPWWNPAVEAQAIDRAHRIGQGRTVNACRLITRDTVEERIWNIQQAKSSIIDSVLGNGGFTRNLTKSDLEYLFGNPEPSQPSTTPLPMIPRHPSNRTVIRNTRAPHLPAIAIKPAWRQRLTSRPNVLPAWRASYGIES